MPGRLAAARASREVSERSTYLPLRGSTQNGLPTDLEDAANDTSATFAQLSMNRLPCNGSTEPSLMAGGSKAGGHEALHASGQSVTFLVSSGHVQQHRTPTATASALALAHAPPAGGGGGSSSPTPQHASFISCFLQPPRSSGAFSTDTTLPNSSASGHIILRSDTLAASTSHGPPTVQHPPAGHSSPRLDIGFGEVWSSSPWGPPLSPSRAMQQARAGSVVAGYGLAGSAGTGGDPHGAQKHSGNVRARSAGPMASVPTAPENAATSHALIVAAGANLSGRVNAAVTSAATITSSSSFSCAVAAGAAASGRESPSSGTPRAGGGGSASTAGLEGEVWKAVAATAERPRSGSSLSTVASATPSSIPLRHSRLRVAGVPAAADSPVAGAATCSAASTSPAHQSYSNDAVAAAAVWMGCQSSNGDCGLSGPGPAASAGGDSGSKAQQQPPQPGEHRGAASTGEGGGGMPSYATVAELFANAPGGNVNGACGRLREPPSAQSSFSVRQTPSDMEDELAENARTRRAMRSAALAAMGMGMDQSPSDTSPDPALATTLMMSTMEGASAEPGLGTSGGNGSHLGVLGDTVGQPNSSGEAPAGVVRLAIRLNHQPGHHNQRRPPNRHSSMPVMKREGVPGGKADRGPGVKRSTLMTRPPLYGGLLPEEDDKLAEQQATTTALVATSEDAGVGGASNTSVPTALLAGDATSLYSRVPSDSPITSQLSLTSSMCGGQGNMASATQQLYHPLQTASMMTAGGGGGAGTATVAAASTAPSGLALAPAPPPLPLSRLASGGPAAMLPTGLMVRLPDLGVGDSSGQRGSFEEDIMRTTPVYGGGGAMGQMLHSNPHLQFSGVGLGGGTPPSTLGGGERLSHVSSRLLSGAHAQHPSGLAALHKAVERLMLQDSGLYAKVQASMKGISSLAKETNKLEFTRDASGATVINQYVVVKTLGRGAFGKVKLCLNTLDGQLYAVKMINRAHLLRQLQKPGRPLRRRAPPPRNTSDTGLMAMQQQQQRATDGNLSISHTNASNNYAAAAQPARASMDDTSPLAAIMREIAVMKKVDHPHVVRLHEVIDPPGSSYLMMVMEYCEGGCVMETRAQTGLVPLGEDVAREYFRQACLGLDYLHYNNVVHGDLKPENMLVAGGGQLKIADFGSSRFLGGDPTDATKTSCTPAFQSPEEIGHMPVDPFAADLWALACCLFCFVFGRLPFVGSCVVDIYRAILTRPHAYPADVAASPALVDLLDRMLDKDPRKRLSLQEVGSHEWVTAGGQLPPLQFLQAGSDGGSGEQAPPPVIHVTHAEQVNAIDRSSFVSLIRARLKEKTCQPGEYLFKEGEEAHCVYMIMAGVVELTQHLRRAPPRANSGHHHTSTHIPGHGPGGGGATSVTGTGGGPPSAGPVGHHAGGYGGGGGEVGAVGSVGADHDASFSVDLDESLTLDHPDGGLITEAMNIVDGKLHIDRQQAIEMRRRMQGTLLGDSAEYVVEVKGPGSVIGEMGMDTAATATHRVSARARGPVTVVKLTEENFFKALLQLYGGAAGAGGGSAPSTTQTGSSVSEAAHPAQAAAKGPAVSPYIGLSAHHLMVMQYLEDSGSFATYSPGSLAANASGAHGRVSLEVGPSTLGAGRGGGGHGSLGYLHHQHSYNAAQMQQAQGSLPQYGEGSGGRRVMSLQFRNMSMGTGRLQYTSMAEMGSAVSGGGPPAAAAPEAASGGPVAALMRSGSGGSGGKRGVARAAGGVRARGSAVQKAAGHSDGSSMHLGVLHTIHSINASRAGGGNSDEGVADL